MRVVRGRAPTIEADRAVVARLLDEVADGAEDAVRVWAPHRQVAFGRRDTRAPGFDRAAAVAREGGFDPVERSVGGRAVAYDGETTLAFARVEAVPDLRMGMDDRYERATVDVRAALRRLGVPAERGEPPDSFCPGQHSLQRDGKVVGIAQRITQGAALTSGVCVVANREELASVLAGVYDALDAPFDPASVGSVEAAGGSADPDVVARTLEGALVGESDVAVERVRET